MSCFDSPLQTKRPTGHPVDPTIEERNHRIRQLAQAGVPVWELQGMAGLSEASIQVILRGKQQRD